MGANVGDIKEFKPKGGLLSRPFIEDFLRRYGDECSGVFICALSKDGEVIDGWSAECFAKVAISLGAIVQLEHDFWNTVFQKRTDT